MSKRTLETLGWLLTIGGVTWASYVAYVAYDFYQLMQSLGGRIVRPEHRWEYLGPALHVTPIILGVVILLFSRHVRD